jgi:hypothetical protein
MLPSARKWLALISLMQKFSLEYQVQKNYGTLLTKQNKNILPLFIYFRANRPNAFISLFSNTQTINIT